MIEIYYSYFTTLLVHINLLYYTTHNLFPKSHYCKLTTTMAEIIVSALLPIVFEKLTSAALNKVARSKEIQSRLKKLKTSLPQIEALLNDAAEKEIQDKRVKGWLIRLQHLAYDVDDILDSLATDAMHHELTEKPAGGITRKVTNLIPTCCSTSSFSSSSNTEMHHKLNDLTIKLQELYDERNDLGLIVKDKRSKYINRRNQTSLLLPGIIGRQGEKEILLEKLFADGEPCDQNNFSIIPIVGMGGMGKTTLARLLYNEPKVEQHFELRAWVCVSDEFDGFNISKLIFESVAEGDNKQKEFKNPNLLQEALRNRLAGKRFLLVLDDVWSEKIEDWDTIVPPFHAVAPGSKIIITTRKEQLLQQLGYDNPYHLNKLSDKDALSLFAQHSVGATNFDSYPTLKLYGLGIVQKCDGLPLALKSLGTSLKTRTDEEDWKEILNSKIWNLKDQGGILPALRLSYHELSASLKQMFAYSSLFPKDCTFEKEDLILLWMAEGFLHKSTTDEPMEMERLGEKYFDELFSKSFFEHVNSDKTLFVMHDLMNDLATSVAGEFFLRLDIEMNNKIEKQSLKKYRHMSFVREEYMTCKKFEAFERANSLRTFLAVPVVVRDGGRESFHLANKILVDILPRLPLLRALCLSNIWINEVPESIGDLKHLRYLNLSQTQITRLPDNVCNLYNLQTLILFGCWMLTELPKNFMKLQNLRHFDIRDTPRCLNMPLGISEMKSLQTLSKILIGGENEFPISKLKNLKNLRRRVCIDGLDKLQNNDQTRKVNLSQMRLSELVVKWSDEFDGFRTQRLETEVLDVLKPHNDNLKKLEVVSYGGTEFPQWVVHPSFIRLTDVSIHNCRNSVFLPPLGQLPSLKKLSIQVMDDVKEVGSEFLGTGPAFPSLEILSFYVMPRWEVWSVNLVGVAVFPCLKELHIGSCPKLAQWEVSANVNVRVFPCLQKLVIYNCPSLLKVSLEALPSLKVLKIDRCGNVLLKSLVCVASLVTELSIEHISGLGDEVWEGIVQYLRAVEELSIVQCNEIRYLLVSGEVDECKEVLGKLKKLYIRQCKKLVRIGRGGGEKEEEGEGSNLPTSLRMLTISECTNLMHLSCPDSIETLEIYNSENLEHLSCPDNIENLEIYRCKNLVHLSCPTSSIQKLRMHGCSSITSVSFPAEEGEGWKKLKLLSVGSSNSVLEELEKQVLIITDNTTNIMPILEHLFIGNWEDLKSISKFTTCFIQITSLAIDDCGRIESFPALQNLVLLKHLTITDCRSMDGPPPLCGGVSGVWPPKLASLEIGNLKRPISEWGPLPTSSLVELRLNGGFGSTDEEEEDVKCFPTSSLLPYSSSSSLTELMLFDFKKMERISPKGLQHLTSLQHLTIYRCPKMKDLPETLLPSLLSLKIANCPNELKEKMMSKSGSYWPLLSHIPQVTFFMAPERPKFKDLPKTLLP
uniref:putative disease resistance RPP13-like protein 1 n=1 Tax=Erigeron canadensis TaxID=72917 RepID=UPI001CB8DFF5|nr:putative disease resistance RPP13-like protein 1 [Erigeron canadensis]XP_043608381.1 putative disease resistance RPP13-like protein 1 [Erigeron canadensis]XP_043608382.1 putative disease resistance RPP13-like protein 1 [Erigeron canadensis]